MDMRKPLVATAIAATALIATANVQAEGFYIFGEASHSDISSSEAQNGVEAKQRSSAQDTADYNELLASYPAGTVDSNGDVLVADLEVAESQSSDDSATTNFSAGLGYRFHENFAAEFAYRDLGDASYTAESTVTGTNASGDLTYRNAYESSAVILRGVGIMPVTDRFAVEGLVGVAYVDTDYAITDQVDGSGYLNSSQEGGSSSDTAFTATYGVGASYAFDEALTGYARWERIHDIDTEDKWGGIEADTISAGLRYHF